MIRVTEVGESEMVSPGVPVEGKMAVYFGDVTGQYVAGLVPEGDVNEGQGRLAIRVNDGAADGLCL